MIKKHCLIIGILLILMVLPFLVKADDNIYIKSDNEIRINNDFKIINTDKIISDILIDNNSIYYFSDKNLYSVNKTNGNVNYKINILNIKNFTQSDNYIFIYTNSDIYKINKLSGMIEDKYHESLIDSIFSFFNIGSSLNSIINNYYNTTNNLTTYINTTENNHANLTNLNWSVSNHTLDTDLIFNNSDTKLLNNGSKSYVRMLSQNYELIELNSETNDSMLKTNIEMSTSINQIPYIDLSVTDNNLNQNSEFLIFTNLYEFYINNVKRLFINKSEINLNNINLTVTNQNGINNNPAYFDSSGKLYRNTTVNIPFPRYNFTDLSSQRTFNVFYWNNNTYPIYLNAEIYTYNPAGVSCEILGYINGNRVIAANTGNSNFDVKSLDYILSPNSYYSFIKTGNIGCTEAIYLLYEHPYY